MGSAQQHGMPDWSRRRLFATAASAATVLAGASGCGLLSGPSGAAPPAAEQRKVRVAVIPSTDMAPLWVAVQEGYFTDEGIDVELVVEPGGEQVVKDLLGGKVDFAFASYPLVVQAEAAGKGPDVRIVADASAALPETTAVVVKRGSPLRGPLDLQGGKRIAVTSRGSMADLAVLAGMKAAKADTAGIRWRTMKFTEMLPQLQKGLIDAAFLAEPFVSLAQTELGVGTLYEPMTGRMEGIPLTGYVALGKTVTKLPNTVAAFQRAVRRTHRQASSQAGDQAIRDALVRNAKLSSEVAAVLHLPTYPITTDPTRLQRVPDLMLEFGLIPQRFDITPLVVRG